MVALLLSAAQAVLAALRPEGLFNAAGPFNNLFTLSLSVDSLSQVVLLA